MIRYVFKRLLLMIPVVLIVILIVFVLMDLTPGTVVDFYVRDDMTADDIAQLEALYGLDKPVLYRYVLYVYNLVQGDMGVSHVSKSSVFVSYFSRLPNTLLLTFTSLFIGSAVAIPLGITAARRAGSLVDNSATTIALIGLSMPAFWLGLLVLTIFSLKLGWFNSGSYNVGFKSLVLPALTNAAMLMAVVTRQTRSSMLEVLKSDFLCTARAKGVPERFVIRKHALGNAMIPIITTLGTVLGTQLAGSVVIESVFTWPGVGRLTVESVMNRDVQLALGSIILTSVLYALVNLLVDILFALFDPRIKSTFVAPKRKKTIAFSAQTGTIGQPEGFSATGTQESEVSLQDGNPLVDPHVVVNGGAAVFRSAAVSPDSPADNAVIRKEGIPYAGAKDYVTRENRDIALSELTGESTEEIMKKYRKKSMLGDIFSRVRRNRGAFIGLIILGVLILTVIASLFIDYDVIIRPNMKASNSPPSWQYPFGTDRTGRSLFLRVIYGTRYSLIIGFAGVAISVILGVLFGSIAGYYSGKIDDYLMRFSEVLAAIPALLLGMVIMAVLGQSLLNLVIAVGVGGIPSFLRITRASLLTVRDQEFVESARAIGLSDFRIMFTQVLPNGLSPIIVTVTTNIGICILVAASLSYLGFGVPVPTPEWGALVSAGREFALSAPWLMAFPGVFIMLTVLAFNLLGDGLRDALDPKLKR